VNAIAVRWCGLLDTYWAPKHATSVTNESMEFLGNRVYRWSDAPFNVVGTLDTRSCNHLWTYSFVDECVHMFVQVWQSIIRIDGWRLPSWWGLCLHNPSTKGWSQVSVFATLLIGSLIEGVPSRHVVSSLYVLVRWVWWVIVAATEFVFWFSWSFRYYSLRMAFSISWVFLCFKGLISLCRSMINEWSSSSWCEGLAMFARFPFSEAPTTGIPFIVDSYLCCHFPWLMTLVLSSFIVIDDVVVVRKVFLQCHGGCQIFFPN